VIELPTSSLQFFASSSSIAVELTMHGAVDVSRRSTVTALPEEFRRSSVIPRAREAQTESFSLSVDEDAPPSFSSKKDLLTLKFYKAGWVERALELIFKINERNTTIRLECYCGCIQFLTNVTSIIVSPLLLSKVGYLVQPTTCTICLVSGIGSILMGTVANLPLVVAPPTSITIFIQAYLLNNKSGKFIGDAAVLLSGFFLLFMGHRPFANFVTKMIPKSVQVGTAIGIGLLTALAGVEDIGLVVAGNASQVSRLGNWSSPEAIIAFFGLQIIIVFSFYHHKLASCYSLAFGALFGWMAEKSWPKQFVHIPTFSKINGFSEALATGIPVLLIFDLCFLYILFLNGLLRTFCEYGGLLKASITGKVDKVPRARWVYFMCGFSTVFSASLGGPPMLISPESISGIKAGSKTGLSSVVCGLLHFVALFFTPFCESFPECASAPILILVGVVMMQNTEKIKWRKYVESVPAFVTLFIIPFTFSIAAGALMGYITLLAGWTLTGKIPSKFLNKIYLAYFPSHSEYLKHSKILKFMGYVYKKSDGVKRVKERVSCLALAVQVRGEADGSGDGANATSSTNNSTGAGAGAAVNGGDQIPSATTPSASSSSTPPLGLTANTSVSTTSSSPIHLLRIQQPTSSSACGSGNK